MALHRIAFHACILALAAWPHGAALAAGGKSKGHFNVTVRLKSAGEATVGSASSGGASSIPVGNSLEARSAVSFHLSGAERYRLRLEVVEPDVQSVEVTGLGSPIRVAREPVEMALPVTPDDADHELRISYRVRYRAGVEPQGPHAPLRITFLP